MNKIMKLIKSVLTLSKLVINQLHINIIVTCRQNGKSDEIINFRPGDT